MRAADKGGADGVVFKPVYFTFEPPQPPPAFLGEYGETLTPQQISKVTGISEQTIRAELEAGRLPGCRIGRQWVTPKPALIAYLYGRVQ